ncbi:MAG TPA: hypothetical protein PL110_09210 [Candidatus Eremiobacteraeota bacterium]|nr:MAG: hypothetical protein BWY64_01459 [bacterium ADurb.Bin363]HPZ08280.1 hypothetical protein [Candidatus Eremiobacteraeota bacterium]
MNYNDIYNSFSNDLTTIEKKYILSKEGQKIGERIKLKLQHYLKKVSEINNLEKLKSNLDYYTTVDYPHSSREIRRRTIYKLGELVSLGDELEKLFYSIEREKTDRNIS